jgi:hypothetical protein
MSGVKTPCPYARTARGLSTVPVAGSPQVLKAKGALENVRKLRDVDVDYISPPVQEISDFIPRRHALRHSLSDSSILDGLSDNLERSRADSFGSTGSRAGRGSSAEQAKPAAIAPRRPRIFFPTTRLLGADASSTVRTPGGSAKRRLVSPLIVVCLIVLFVRCVLVGLPRLAELWLRQLHESRDSLSLVYEEI